MSVVSYPPTPPAGYLWWLGWYLDSFANKFDSVADDVQGVFIIGEHLATPFRYFAYYIRAGASNAFNADTWLQEVRARITALYDGYKFREILDWVSIHFFYIRQNSVNWVASRIIAHTWHMSYVLYNPRYFVEKFFKEISPFTSGLLVNFWGILSNTLISNRSWFWNIINNPKQFVKDYVRSLVWWVPTFLDNPTHFIRLFIRQIVPWFGEFLDNPAYFIFVRLLTINWVLRELLIDPDGYIKRKIAQALNLPQGFWNNPFYFITLEVLKAIRKFMSSYEKELKQTIIDIILWFM